MAQKEALKEMHQCVLDIYLEQIKARILIYFRQLENQRTSYMVQERAMKCFFLHPYDGFDKNGPYRFILLNVKAVALLEKDWVVRSYWKKCVTGGGP